MLHVSSVVVMALAIYAGYSITNRFITDATKSFNIEKFTLLSSAPLLKSAAEIGLSKHLVIS